MSAVAPSGRRVFLTGATGFIGGRLARLLAARGDRIVCLVRDSAKARPLEALGAEIVQGDINDDIALRKGLGGADLAYHVAGIYDTGRVDEGMLERANVDGTRGFLQYARWAEVPHAVYVSTAVALGPTEADGVEENDWRGPFPSVYHRTKTHAHRLAREAQAAGMPLTIACPAFVYGEGDEGPAGRFLQDLLKRRMPGLLKDPATFSYVHVDDVAAALLALGDQPPGGVWVLGGQNMTVNEYGRKVCSIAGVKPPPIEFPVAAARLTGSLLDLVSRLTRKRFSLSRENVDVACCRPWAPGWSKTARALDYAPRSVDEALPAVVKAAQKR